jgi:hypothetical protein
MIYSFGFRQRLHRVESGLSGPLLDSNSATCYFGLNGRVRLKAALYKFVRIRRGPERLTQRGCSLPKARWPGVQQSKCWYQRQRPSSNEAKP